MHEVKHIDGFDFFKNKTQISQPNNSVYVYKCNDRYFLVCDVGYHAMELMQVEVEHEEALQALSEENSHDIIDKYFRGYGIL